MSTIETIPSIPANVTTSAGINGSDYRIYDDNGQCIGIDYSQYVADKKAQEESEEEKIPAVKKEKRDEFIKESEEKKAAEIESIQSKYATEKIDSNYKDALIKYASLLSKGNTEEETKIVNQWTAIREEANKLTSVTASNTTVLEGVKEFIDNITNLANITKHYKSQKDEKDRKETLISIKSAEDIRNEKNKVQVYETNFFKSAVNVYDAEDDAIAVNE